MPPPGAFDTDENTRADGFCLLLGATKGNFTSPLLSTHPLVSLPPPPAPPSKTESKRKGNWLDELKHRKATSKRSKATAVALPGGGGASGASGECGGAAGAAGGKPATGPGSHVCLYRFNEGYTNAVKRPLLMQELLD
jgi:hypothetical protein